MKMPECKSNGQVIKECIIDELKQNYNLMVCIKEFHDKLFLKCFTYDYEKKKTGYLPMNEEDRIFLVDSRGCLNLRINSIKALFAEPFRGCI